VHRLPKETERLPALSMKIPMFKKRKGGGAMRAQEHTDTLESPAELFITFPHPILCSEPGCEQLTTWGYAVKWNRDREYLLRPYCWEHGAALYKTVSREGNSQRMAQESNEQQESVARFVVSYFDGCGAATVLGQIPIDEVVGWQPYTRDDFDSDEDYDNYLKKRHVPEMAWSVRYIREDGTCEDVQVVWSFNDFRFYLFRSARDR
jgi:hypothetical protein